MTRTDIQIGEVTAAVNTARRVAFAEAGYQGLAQVLLCLEIETKMLRDHIRAARVQVARVEYPCCEE
jgi:hypothetical protein